MTGHRGEIARRLGGEALPARTEVIFLHDNTEDVLRALRAYQPMLALDDELFAAAIEREELTARDRILKESAAWHRASVREALLAEEKMASLRRLVHKVAALVDPARP